MEDEAVQAWSVSPANPREARLEKGCGRDVVGTRYGLRSRFGMKTVRSNGPQRRTREARQKFVRRGQ